VPPRLEFTNALRRPAGEDREFVPRLAEKSMLARLLALPITNVNELEPINPASLWLPLATAATVVESEVALASRRRLKSRPEKTERVLLSRADILVDELVLAVAVWLA